MAVEEASIVTEAAERGDLTDIEKQESRNVNTEPKKPELYHITSHASHHHDMANVPIPTAARDKYTEAGDEIYDRFSHHRKMIVVAVLSYCGFLAPISSTTVLAAVPEVAQQYNTSGSIINVSNALYLIFMGLSPVFWGPIGQVYGRRIVCNSREIDGTVQTN